MIESFHLLVVPVGSWLGCQTFLIYQNIRLKSEELLKGLESFLHLPHVKNCRGNQQHQIRKQKNQALISTRLPTCHMYMYV